jgi:hypothetical protein
MPAGDTLRIVIPLSLALTHFVVPLVLVAWLALTRARTRVHLLGVAAIVVSGTIVLLITQIGSSGASYYLYWFWIAGLALAALRVARRWGGLPWSPRSTETRSWIVVSVLGALGSLSAYYAALRVTGVATAGSYVGEPKALAFPLEGGRFVILFGGGNRSVNLTHAQSTSSRYALDIGALGPLAFGATGAAGLYPDDLHAYAAYDTRIVSPCSGSVAWTLDGLPDLKPGDMDADNSFGNHVVLHCDGDSVLLGHLRPGTIVVEEGQAVRLGDAIGRVGNSGNTMLPHLHIHTARGLATDLPDLRERVPVPMLFDDRFPVRFDIFERR